MSAGLWQGCLLKRKDRKEIGRPDIVKVACPSKVLEASEAVCILPFRQSESGPAILWSIFESWLNQEEAVACSTALPCVLTGIV